MAFKPLRPKNGDRYYIENVRNTLIEEYAAYDEGEPPGYTMFVSPVSAILDMDVIEPHQVLLQKGLVVPWRPEMRVIFVSHEWCGYWHADPKGEQLQTLKRVLTRLMQGAIDRVEAHWFQRLVMTSQQGIPAAEWAAILPDMYVWLDFASIPQPTCSVPLLDPHVPSDLSDCDSSAQTESCPTSHANSLPALHSDSEVSSRSKGSEYNHTQTKSDHRFFQGALMDKLNKAVESIPKYIERSWMMFVLVPVCQHIDRQCVCNFASWRRRGWCRLEHMAACLCRRPVRILISDGPESTPYFTAAHDALFLSPCLGDFTCCALGHTFNGRAVPCDKDRVRPVLEHMISLKTVYYLNIGLRSQELFMNCVHDILLRGIPERKTLCAPVSQPSVCSGASPLVRFKNRLRWNEADDERAISTGHSLLYFAVLADEVDVVPEALKHLEQTQISIDSLVDDIRIFNGQGRGQMTVLLCAMALASFEMVTRILDAKADPFLSLPTKLGTDAFAMACAYGRAGHIEKWLERFPDWNLANKKGIFGTTYLAIAANSPAMGSIDVMRVLLRYEADPNSGTDAGTTAIIHACLKDDTDVEGIRLLLASGANVNMRLKPKRMSWLIVFWICRFVTRVRRVWYAATLASWHGMTALHVAAERGDVEVVRALVAAGADVHSRNFSGRTAFQTALAKFREIPDVLGAALSPINVVASVNSGKLERPSPVKVGADVNDDVDSGMQQESVCKSMEESDEARQPRVKTYESAMTTMTTLKTYESTMTTPSSMGTSKTASSSGNVNATPKKKAKAKKGKAGKRPRSVTA